MRERPVSLTIFLQIYLCCCVFICSSVIGLQTKSGLLLDGNNDKLIISSSGKNNTNNNDREKGVGGFVAAAAAGDNTPGIIVGSGTRCWTNGNGQEARWLNEGETVDRGRFWYECSSEGKLRPAGCLNEQRKRVPLNGTFLSNTYLLQCVLWGGMAQQKVVGCAPMVGEQQRQFRVGENWADGEFWWECAWEGDRLKQRLAGCIEPGIGRRLGIGELLDSEGTIYECQQRVEGTVWLRAVGCIVVQQEQQTAADDGDDGKLDSGGGNGTNGNAGTNAEGDEKQQRRRERHFRVGQQWKEGNFLFYCKRTPPPSGANAEDNGANTNGSVANGTIIGSNIAKICGKCQKTCIGCVLQGQSLFDGDRLRLNHSVYECEIRAKRHALKPVACVSAEGVERVVDCEWHEPASNGHHRLRRQCVLRAGRAVVDTVGCVLTKDGYGRIFLRPGTFTVWHESMDRPAIGVACRQRQPATTTLDGSDNNNSGNDDGNGEDDEPVLDTFPVEQLAEKTQGMRMDADPRQ